MYANDRLRTSSSTKLKTVTISAGSAALSRGHQPVTVGSAICRVRATGSSRLRLAGHVQVEEEDRVTLYQAENVEEWLVMVRKEQSNGGGEGELGRVPVGALCLNKSLLNADLDVLEVLADHPALLRSVINHTKTSVSFLVEMAIARGLLKVFLTELVRSEIQEKMAHSCEMEALRSDSPAVRLIGALFQRPASQAFCLDAVTYVLQGIRKRADWTSVDIRAVIEDALIFLKKSSSGGSFPEELSAVIFSVRNAAFACLMARSPWTLAGSVLFLRLLCPALAMPHASLKATPAETEKLMTVAKALQLLANRTRPQEGSVLESMSTYLEVRCEDLQSILQHCSSSNVLRVAQDMDLRPAGAELIALLGEICLKLGECPESQDFFEFRLKLDSSQRTRSDQLKNIAMTTM